MRHVWIGVAVFAAVGLMGTAASAGKRIGMLLFAKELRYSEAQERTVVVLRAAGYTEPDTTYIVESADGNKTKAFELAKKLCGLHFDLIVTFGTSATVPVAKECPGTPLVFSYVYDPLEANIAASWNSSGNNTTGVSNKVAMTTVLAPLKKIGPIKTLAVLYTPGEKNSESQLKDLQHAQTDVGIKMVAVPITNAAEVRPLVTEAAEGNDAIYITGAGFLDGQLSTIVDAASKAGKPTLSHLEDATMQGVLFSVGVDRLAVGDKTGQLAARVLKGEKPASIPIVVPEKINVTLNTKTAKAYKLPNEFLSLVTKRVE